MKKILLALTFFSLLSFTAISQSYFTRNVVIGSSFSPEWHLLDNGFNSEFSYLGISWQKNIAIRLTKHFYVGMTHINVYGEHISPPSYQRGKINNFMFGGFTQFRLPATEKLSFTADLGYFIGNHCSCIEDNPIQVPDLRYFDWGIGLDYQIYKRLYFDLNLHFAFILNDLERKYAANGAHIGIDYRLGKF